MSFEKYQDFDRMSIVAISHCYPIGFEGQRIWPTLRCDVRCIVKESAQLSNV